MPPHASKPVARVLERPRRLSLAVLVIGLVLIPTAAASLSVADDSDRGAHEVANSSKQRWFGALTEADRVAASLGSSTTTSSTAPSFRVVELGTLGGSSGGYTGEPPGTSTTLARSSARPLSRAAHIDRSSIGAATAP
jgi:hypothetical protein